MEGGGGFTINCFCFLFQFLTENRENRSEFILLFGKNTYMRDQEENGQVTCVARTVT